MNQQLSIVIGPMFSGKSTYLINKIEEAKNENKKILVINHSIDKRYNENKITNHNKISVGCISLNLLNNIFKYCEDNNINLNEIDNMFVDEAQFFSDLKTTILIIMKDYPHINITCVGLDGDYKQEPFNDGQLLNLIPYSTSVKKLLSNCYKCKCLAAFTKRMDNICSKEQILVGSSESYYPACYIHK